MTEILSSKKNPYRVHLPIADKDVELNLLTGLAEWTARRRFQRDKIELDVPEGEGGWLELEIIAHCIHTWPFPGTKPTKFEDLLFLTDQDIRMLKLAHLAANSLDDKAFSIIHQISQENWGNAIWQALFLVKEINLPFEEAMKLSQDERILLVVAVQKFLAVTNEMMSQASEEQSTS